MKKDTLPCTCTRDPFGGIPAELRPRSRKKSSLRKVTCPSCGKEYWTNRETEETDLCFDCEKAESPPRQGAAT